MKSLGEILREARERKGVTTSEVAAATRIKKQIIEDLEQNRLQRTYAPIYAKGFIRIYGEYLELNESVLIEAYELQRRRSQESPAADRRKPSQGVSSTRAVMKRNRKVPADNRPTLKASRFLSRQLSAITVTFAIWRQRLLQWVIRLKPASASSDAGGSDAGGELPDASSRWQSLRNAVHGPYRPHAVAVVVLGLLLILLLIAGKIVQLRQRSSVHPETMPAATVETLTGDSVIDVSLPHEPPPPYY